MADDFTAITDKSRVNINENLTLQITYRGSIPNDEPDFSLLKNDFSILGIRPFESNQSVNGVRSSKMVWSITLRPARPGKITIPSFKLNGNKTSPLKIEVTRNQVDSSNDFIIETNIDKQSAFINEQIIIRYTLNAASTIRSVDKQEPKIDGAEVYALPVKQSRRDVSGLTYHVLEYSYAIIPTKDQVLVIPALRWDITSSRVSNNRYQLVRKKTQEKIIRIKTIPDEFPKDSPWISASSFQLSEQWPTTTSTLKIGEPVTRTLALTATGLKSSELPPLHSNNESTDFRAYLEQPELTAHLNENGLLSTRTESAAIVLSKAGTVMLPSIRIPWWNTNTQSLEYATLPEKTLTAIGGASPAPPRNIVLDSQPTTPRISRNEFVNVEPSEKAESSAKIPQSNSLFLWKLVGIVSLIANIIFAVLLVLKNQVPSRNKKAEPPHAEREKSLESAVKSLKSGNNHQFLKTFTLWAEKQFKTKTLEQTCSHLRKLNHKELADLVLRIDQSLYSKDEPSFSGNDKIIDCLQNLTSELKKTSREKTTPLSAFNAA
ncbi:MAG: hypothetical protein ACI93R_002913 [Flavobacteriales bacterium]|jgi:hypothetical protein